MRPYLDLLQRVVDEGQYKDDRTGTGTFSVFGTQTRYDLTEGFPLVTTKKMATKALTVELLWMIAGGDNVDGLHEHNVHIWDAWADEVGDLGPIYGVQWREWYSGYYRPTIDQLTNLIDEIKANPSSRRLILSAWNVAEIPDMALPPCHMMAQFYVNNGKLSCHMYQRSGDLFLGVPFDIAEYALLTEMIAQVTGLEAYELVHTIGDAHIYLNHVSQVVEQLSREPLPLPTLWLNPDVTDIDDFTLADISFENYVHHDAIHAPVAV